MLKASRNELHRLRPSLWARDRIGFAADEQQVAFLDTDATDVIVLWSRQTGKTTCGGIKLAHNALFHPRSLSLVASATQRQAALVQRQVLLALQGATRRGWQQVKEVEVVEDDGDGGRIVRCSVLSLELANGSEVVSVPASSDSTRGYSPDAICLDEASRIPDAVMDSIRPMRAAHPTRLYLMSTPNGKRGFFWKEWSGTDAAWLRLRMVASECPRITPAFLERERQGMSSESMFAQEYLCEFLELKGALFTQELIERMTERDYEPWPMPRLQLEKERVWNS